MKRRKTGRIAIADSVSHDPKNSATEARTSAALFRQIDGDQISQRGGMGHEAKLW